MPTPVKNPYAEFQQPATANPYAEFQQPKSSEPTATMRPLTTMEQLTAIKPITSQMSPVEKATTFMGNIGGGGMGVLLHPLDTVQGIASSLIHPIDTLKATYDAANTRPMETLSSGIGQTAALTPLAEGAVSLKSIPGGLKRGVVGDINKPITPNGITPAQRYSSARALGVNLDAADATNSTPLKAIKKVNENSLLGSDIYDKNRSANTAALHDSTGKVLDSMYSGDRESGGRTLQNALKRDQEGLQASATEGFNSLPSGTEIPGSVNVGKAAQSIRDDQAKYQKLFPSLVPKQASSVVDNLTKLAPAPPPEGISITPTADGNYIAAKSEHGQVSGNLNGNLHINYADVLADQRGKGYGKALYKALIDDSLGQGRRVFSDKTVETPAARVYDALGRDGYQINNNVGGEIAPNEYAPEGAVYGKNNSHAFEVAPGKGFTPPPKMTFGMMQQLRSDLLELGRTNPDLVQNQGGGWLQRLAGATDSAMTDASTGLSPAHQQIFRDANAKWADMKSTYDDPTSPLYHAVRTDNPSTLSSGIGPKTPENVRNLEPRLGADIGALRRGTVEGALKTTNDGSPNFKTFGTQLNRIPADYRAQLFTPAQQEMLGHVQNVSNVLGQDFNPSGSAKLGQKVAEASMLGSTVLGHPTGLLPLAQYPVARLMHSPAVVDWMMRSGPTARPIPVDPLRVAPAGVSSDKKKR